MSDPIVIAVDGPGGAGKGELTRRLAEALPLELQNLHQKVLNQLF